MEMAEIDKAALSNTENAPVLEIPESGLKCALELKDLFTDIQEQTRLRRAENIHRELQPAQINLDQWRLYVQSNACLLEPNGPKGRDLLKNTSIMPGSIWQHHINTDNTAKAGKGD